MMNYSEAKEASRTKVVKELHPEMYRVFEGFGCREGDNVMETVCTIFCKRISEAWQDGWERSESKDLTWEEACKKYGWEE